MRAAVYASTDECLMNIVILQGSDFEEDNHRLWEILHPLVYGTAAWEYIKDLVRTKDGRTAWLTLTARGEGDSIVDARRRKAKETLLKAQYTGRSK
jgi:hypothetical protein